MVDFLLVVLELLLLLVMEVTIGSSSIFVQVTIAHQIKLKLFFIEFHKLGPITLNLVLLCLIYFDLPRDLGLLRSNGVSESIVRTRIHLG